MGLLDQLFSGSPGQQGLLAGASALLNAGGPSRMPISFGQGVAQALTAGQGAYADAQTQMLKKQMQDLQLKEYERKMQEAQEADEKRRQLLEIAKKAVIPGDPSVGEVGAPHWSGLGNTFQPEGPKGFNKSQFINDLYSIEPLKALELSQKPEDDMVVVGGNLVNKRTGEVRFAAEPKEPKVSGLKQEFDDYKKDNPGYKGNMLDYAKEKAAAGRSINGGGSSYFQPVQTAQGIMVFNARTGQMELARGPDGKPILGAVADPALQGNIAGAKEGAKNAAGRANDAAKANLTGDKLLSAVTEAEGLLKQGPTGSGIGAAADYAGRLVGVTSKSAKVAARLETLSGWITSNVPRMEGPQSNFDLENYKTMAAKIGDRTVPVPERLAALQTLKEIQEKYKHLNTKTSNVDDLVNKHRSK